jgi:hypothetical protein
MITKSRLYRINFLFLSVSFFLPPLAFLSTVNTKKGREYFMAEQQVLVVERRSIRITRAAAVEIAEK